MAKTLIANTEPFIKLEKTELDAAASAGSTVSLTVKNSDGLAANDYIVIGEEGTETAELQQISSITDDTTIVVGTLKFAHKAGDPIRQYRYNQRKFYGATSETGTYTELTGDGSPVTIEPDDPQGARLEYSGSTYTYFKATYYNSTTTDETDTDDALAVLADESARYTSIYRIRKHAGIADNPYLTDEYVETKRRQAENEINSAIFSRYTLPLSEIPDLIVNVCTTLAAGYIAYEELEDDDPGKRWLGEARAILKAIKGGKQVLLASDGTELARVTRSDTLRGYPDSSLDDSTTEGTKFKVSDKY